jgi:Fe2+ or Zn2+ uptake regulation protein
MSNNTLDDNLAALQQRCKAQGLVLTPSRLAILSALLEQSEAHDAVPLLQAAQAHHAQTRIGTVYRFLRELEQRGMVDAHAPAHGRTRWRLRDGATTDALFVASDIQGIIARAKVFLSVLEQLSAAERNHATQE